MYFTMISPWIIYWIVVKSEKKRITKTNDLIGLELNARAVYFDNYRSQWESEFPGKWDQIFILFFSYFLEITAIHSSPGIRSTETDEFPSFPKFRFENKISKLNQHHELLLLKVFLLSTWTTAAMSVNIRHLYTSRRLFLKTLAFSSKSNIYIFIFVANIFTLILKAFSMLLCLLVLAWGYVV